MSTSDKLKKPQIIQIAGSTIRIAHPDVSGNFSTSLGSAIAAAGTNMTVLDTGANTGDGFEDNSWFITGNIGDSETEENDVNGAVTRGTSMTVTNALSFAHEIDAPVRKIYERGIGIYGAATDGGAGTLIASVDAKTSSGRQLEDAVMIEWHRQYTEYTMISTDTAYAYYYVKFTDGTTESDASDYVVAAGLSSSSVAYFINQAADMTNTTLDTHSITMEQCIKWANDCQTAITQYVYQEPRSGQLIQKDWPFEVTDDSGTVTMSTNVNKYGLSGLNMKYADRGVITIQMGSLREWDKIAFDEYKVWMRNSPYTEVATAASIGDTSLVVDSNVEFSDPNGTSTATLYVGGQTLSYTGITGTTTFTGIPASGTGSITANLSVDDAIWQNRAPGLPRAYVIHGGNLYLNIPISSTYDNYPLNMTYFKKLTALTEASDTTVVSFTNVFQYYIGSMMERRKQNTDKAKELMTVFNKMVLDNAIHQKVSPTKRFEYYRFQDPQSAYLSEGKYNYDSGNYTYRY